MLAGFVMQHLTKPEQCRGRHCGPLNQGLAMTKEGQVCEANEALHIAALKGYVDTGQIVQSESFTSAVNAA